MPKDVDELFAPVALAVEDALLIAWDECHKIYLAMDAEQADWFRLNYKPTFEGTPAEMLATLRSWWDQSCFLRFVSAVRTNHDNPNAGFDDLIPQFAEEDEEEGINV